MHRYLKVLGLGVKASSMLIAVLLCMCSQNDLWDLANQNDGSDKIIYFEDFNNGAWDSTKWDAQGSPIGVSGGSLVLDNAALDIFIRYKDVIGAGVEVMVEFGIYNPDGADGVINRTAHVYIKEPSSNLFNVPDSNNELYAMYDDTGQMRRYKIASFDQDLVNRNGYTTVRFEWRADGLYQYKNGVLMYFSPFSLLYGAYDSAGYIYGGTMASFSSGFKLEFREVMGAASKTYIDYIRISRM